MAGPVNTGVFWGKRSIELLEGNMLHPMPETYHWGMVIRPSIRSIGDGLWFGVSHMIFCNFDDLRQVNSIGDYGIAIE